MEDLYGAALFNTLQRELPCYQTDSAVIYRSLQELEGDGSVSSYWETNTSGPAKKWYKITDKCAYSGAAEPPFRFELSHCTAPSYVDKNDMGTIEGGSAFPACQLNNQNLLSLIYLCNISHKHTKFLQGFALESLQEFLRYYK